MNLGDIEVIPGVILDADDPLKQGRVKCGSANDFNTVVVDEELLPWVKPLFINGYQRYSKMQEKQKVWILKDMNNVNLYWYLPAYDMTDDAQSIINENDEDNVEILHLRQTCGNNMMQTVDDKHGYVTETPMSKVTVGVNGNVNIETPGANVDVNNNTIELKTNDTEPQYMLLGNEVVKLFNDIAQKIGEAAMICNSNIALFPLMKPLNDLSLLIQSQTKNLQSKTIKNS